MGQATETIMGRQGNIYIYIFTYGKVISRPPSPSGRYIGWMLRSEANRCLKDSISASSNTGPKHQTFTDRHLFRSLSLSPSTYIRKGEHIGVYTSCTSPTPFPISTTMSSWATTYACTLLRPQTHRYAYLATSSMCSASVMGVIRSTMVFGKVVLVSTHSLKSGLTYPAICSTTCLICYANTTSDDQHTTMKTGQHTVGFASSPRRGHYNLRGQSLSNQSYLSTDRVTESETATIKRFSSRPTRKHHILNSKQKPKVATIVV